MTKKKAEKSKNPKGAASPKIWDDRQMKLYKVDAGGDLKHPKVYLGFEVQMSLVEFRARNLDGINHVGIDRGKAVDLEPRILGYGDGFSIQVVMGQSDPDQEVMFAPGTVVAKVESEKIASASLKEQTLKHSILVPINNWDTFGRLREYVGQEMKVSVWPGVIAGEGQQTVE